jgi:4-carboxymuconolactone decarboxylase
MLRDLADGDVTVIAPLIGRVRAVAGLDDATFQLAEIIALTAVDAPPASWFAHLEGHEGALELERVAGALLAIAPIVGTPRLVAAAANILAATELAEDIDEAPSL